MKEGSRIAAFDDSPFLRHDTESLVVGVIGRVGSVEGVLSFKVKVDGTDSTQRLVSSVKTSRFRGQVKVVALNGVTLAGLNVIDITRIRSVFGLPVISITRKRPRRTLLAYALRKRGDRRSLVLFKRLTPLITVTRHSGYYVQSIGDDYEVAKRLVDESAALLRLAHMIASGVRYGESRGRV